MTDRFTYQILSHIKHKAYEPQRAGKLADELGVEPDEREDFDSALAELIESRQVVIGSAQCIALPPLGREVTGTFRKHERGFGFLIPDQANPHGDLFIPAPNVGEAMTGDRVRADVIHRKQRGPGGHSPYIGRIRQIIERANTVFVGTLTKQGAQWLVVPDGKALDTPVVIRDPSAKGAKTGSKVSIELTHYPEGDYLPEGVIVEVLGDAGRPAVETEAVMRAFDLPDKFDPAVTDNARRVVKWYDKNCEQIFRERTDLRDVFTLTIDPPDAKDFDDAISIERMNDGWELGVHIADVSAFVEAGGAIDTEAQKRGNSVYLPRRVLPMLPEVLSNGLCSLQPNVPRLARTVFIKYDHAGSVQSSRFARAVIESDHRLTYLEAQALIDGDENEARKHAKTDKPYSKQLRDALQKMNDLSRIIRKRRQKQGMIALDLPEVELVFDEDGHVVDAQPEDDAYTHKLIEAFMVEANEAAARVFADLNVPLIRRIHPDPGSHDIAELRVFARVAGFNIPADPSRKELQALLEKVKGTPASRAVSFAVLRTLTKAEYSPALIGHFALASEHYTHYTSPIRRYTDLTVHRALDVLTEELEGFDKIPTSPKKRRALGNRIRNNRALPSPEELETIANRCSNTERNAEQAERELRKFLVLQLLEDHVGDVFPGTVTGATNFGIFVQIDKYLVDGMIKATDLPGAPAEQWKLNQFTGAMTAQRSGKAIAIGDTFGVKIVKVDLPRREMDLAIADESLIRAASTGGASKQRKKTKPARDTGKTLQKRPKRGNKKKKPAKRRGR